MHVSVRHVYIGAQRGPKRALVPLERELPAVVSRLMWVLGADSGSLHKEYACLTTEPLKLYFQLQIL